MSPGARVLLSIGEVAVLAAWVGAVALFAAVVAPAAFALLPSRTLAGLVVGRVLPVLFVLGMSLGVLLVAAEALWRRTGWGIAAAGGVMGATCAVAHLVVGARIARVRAQIPGEIESLAPSDARRLAFGQLHGLSVALLGVALLAALAAMILAARAATR